MNILLLLNLTIILIGIFVNINKCKADSTCDQIVEYIQYGLYSIKWNETGQDQTLQVPEGSTLNYFPVGISNEYAIIGAPLEDNGSVYIYKRASNGTWNLVQRLKSDQCINGFGLSVEISNGYSIIGCDEENSAYIYERASDGTWNLAQKLESGQNTGNFGYAVGISNEYAIIGSNADNSAYIYERAPDGTWNFVQRLESDQGSNEDFGVAVGISNEYIIISAPISAAYIYERAPDGTWNLVQRLENSQTGNRFGYAVGISNGYVIIGAPTEDIGNSINNIGAAYIYERAFNGTCNLAQRLEIGENGNGGWFGFSVGISNGYAIIGSPIENIEGISNAGAIYIYRPCPNGVY